MGGAASRGAPRSLGTCSPPGSASSHSSLLVTFSGVFTSLRDPAEFAKVRVDSENRTVVWPSGADLAPDTLYDMIARQRPR
ncbi:MAG: DUF2442 domain-containing protein [Candidatus Eisenbacteria bacterium]|uniref:DUF2442 domain-containing protein n=1 Tax=Eiseniibacteriota bacterium TaxID=2212470 RepID=A0A849SRQ6_UNCEI|nr:DUF2442 domain-containing protein [Candidatus Eisenbacteria bacterium]